MSDTAGAQEGYRPALNHILASTCEATVPLPRPHGGSQRPLRASTESATSEAKPSAPLAELSTLCPSLSEGNRRTLVPVLSATEEALPRTRGASRTRAPSRHTKSTGGLHRAPHKESACERVSGGSTALTTTPTITSTSTSTGASTRAPERACRGSAEVGGSGETADNGSRSLNSGSSPAAPPSPSCSVHSPQSQGLRGGESPQLSPARDPHGRFALLPAFGRRGAAALGDEEGRSPVRPSTAAAAAAAPPLSATDASPSSTPPRATALSGSRSRRFFRLSGADAALRVVAAARRSSAAAQGLSSSPNPREAEAGELREGRLRRTSFSAEVYSPAASNGLLVTHLARLLDSAAAAEAEARGPAGRPTLRGASTSLSGDASAGLRRGSESGTDGTGAAPSLGSTARRGVRAGASSGLVRLTSILSSSAVAHPHRGPHSQLLTAALGASATAVPVSRSKAAAAAAETGGGRARTPRPTATQAASPTTSTEGGGSSHGERGPSARVSRQATGAGSTGGGGDASRSVSFVGSRGGADDDDDEDSGTNRSASCGPAAAASMHRPSLSSTLRRGAGETGESDSAGPAKTLRGAKAVLRRRAPGTAGVGGGGVSVAGYSSPLPPSAVGLGQSIHGLARSTHAEGAFNVSTTGRSGDRARREGMAAASSSITGHAGAQQGRGERNGTGSRRSSRSGTSAMRGSTSSRPQTVGREAALLPNAHCSSSSSVSNRSSRSGSRSSGRSFDRSATYMIMSGARGAAEGEPMALVGASARGVLARASSPLPEGSGAARARSRRHETMVDLPPPLVEMLDVSTNSLPGGEAYRRPSMASGPVGGHALPVPTSVPAAVAVSLAVAGRSHHTAGEAGTRSAARSTRHRSSAPPTASIGLSHRRQLEGAANGSTSGEDVGGGGGGGDDDDDDDAYAAEHQKKVHAMLLRLTLDHKSPVPATAAANVDEVNTDCAPTVSHGAGEGRASGAAVESRPAHTVESDAAVAGSWAGIGNLGWAGLASFGNASGTSYGRGAAAAVDGGADATDGVGDDGDAAAAARPATGHAAGGIAVTAAASSSGWLGIGGGGLLSSQDWYARMRMRAANDEEDEEAARPTAEGPPPVSTAASADSDVVMNGRPPSPPQRGRGSVVGEGARPAPELSGHSPAPPVALRGRPTFVRERSSLLDAATESSSTAAAGAGAVAVGLSDGKGLPASERSAPRPSELESETGRGERFLFEPAPPRQPRPVAPTATTPTSPAAGRPRRTPTDAAVGASTSTSPAQGPARPPPLEAPAVVDHTTALPLLHSPPARLSPGLLASATAVPRRGPPSHPAPAAALLHGNGPAAAAAAGERVRDGGGAAWLDWSSSSPPPPTAAAVADGTRSGSTAVGAVPALHSGQRWSRTRSPAAEGAAGGTGVSAAGAPSTTRAVGRGRDAVDGRQLASTSPASGTATTAGGRRLSTGEGLHAGLPIPVNARRRSTSGGRRQSATRTSDAATMATQPESLGTNGNLAASSTTSTPDGGARGSTKGSSPQRGGAPGGVPGAGVSLSSQPFQTTTRRRSSLPRVVRLSGAHLVGSENAGVASSSLAIPVVPSPLSLGAVGNAGASLGSGPHPLSPQQQQPQPSSTGEGVALVSARRPQVPLSPSRDWKASTGSTPTAAAAAAAAASTPVVATAGGVSTPLHPLLARASAASTTALTTAIGCGAGGNLTGACMGKSPNASGDASASSGRSPPRSRVSFVTAPAPRTVR